jgi:hypothetical protein
MKVAWRPADAPLRRRSKRRAWWAGISAVLLAAISAIAYASVPKVWVTGESLKAGDLDTNFQSVDARLTALENANANLSRLLASTAQYGQVGAPGASTISIAGGGASPNAASVSWGDGTGWKLHFGTQHGGSFVPLVTIVDKGRVGIGTDSPNASLQVASGDVYASEAGSGIVLKSPNGTLCARVSLSDTGTLTTTSTPCP